MTNPDNEWHHERGASWTQPTKPIIVVIPFQTTPYHCEAGCTIILKHTPHDPIYVATGECEHIKVMVTSVLKEINDPAWTDPAKWSVE